MKIGQKPDTDRFILDNYPMEFQSFPDLHSKHDQVPCFDYALGELLFRRQGNFFYEELKRAEQAIKENAKRIQMMERLKSESIENLKRTDNTREEVQRHKLQISLSKATIKMLSESSRKLKKYRGIVQSIYSNRDFEREFCRVNSDVLCRWHGLLKERQETEKKRVESHNERYAKWLKRNEKAEK